MSHSSQEKTSRSIAEWTTFGIASTILAAIAGLVIYAWVTEQDRPPLLTLERREQIREAQGQFYVPFEVANTGGETVESVQVVAELRVNGQIEESGDQQIDFLSDGETREGAFVFRRDPRRGELTVRVASYKLP
jgi:uncharacterized protein (TIGR02588 family)